MSNTTSVKGYNYSTNTKETLSTSENDLVVSTNQPKGKLVNVLFEPNGKLTDSLTYDITAWSLPYAYGLEAIAATYEVPGKTKPIEPSLSYPDINRLEGYLAL